MSEEVKEEVFDVSDSSVLDKYRQAGQIANEALAAVKAAVKPGVKVVELCQIGDNVISEKTGKIFNTKKNGVKIEKGIGFPTSVSVNHVAGHFSPLKDHTAELKANDVVKIDLGVHIDGFVATVADTVVVFSEEDAKNAEFAVTGKVADLLHAATNALEAALRTIKPGNKNTQVTEILAKIAAIYGVNVVQGVLSHNLERFTIDGNKVILSKGDAETKVDEFEFQVNEVYAMDVIFSTGEGKPKETGEKTTVFKRSVDTRYKLKMKASNYVLGQINDKFPFFPFTIRAIEDETKARLGITELVSHGLVQDYPVLEEKEGEYVAQVKATIGLLSSGSDRITGTTADLSKFKTEKKIEDEDLKALLATQLKKKKKKTKKPAEAKNAESKTEPAAE